MEVFGVLFPKKLPDFSKTRCLILITELYILIGYGKGHQIDWRAHKPKTCVRDDNFTRPDEEPIDVYSGISVTSIFDVDERRMQFGLQIYLRAIWKEPMLNLDREKITRNYVIPEYISECIWQPDLIFPNAKEAELYEVTQPNNVLKLIESGYIYQYGRYKLMVICNMNFRYYPMDTQICFLEIGFMASRNNEATLKWQEEASEKIGKNLKLYSTIQPMQFSLKKISVGKNEFRYTSGNTTILKVIFQFERHIAASLVNTYIPSFLLVCLSWVSFWLDVNAVPGRVTLGVTALLTIATQVVHSRANLPPLSYMTAIDIWLFGCLLMVFSSLIEFTIVQNCFRRHSRKKKNIVEVIRPRSPKVACSTVKCSKDLMIQGDRLDSVCQTRHRSSTKSMFPSTSDGNSVTKEDYILDRVSRYFFPAVMLIFSSVYWSYYLFSPHQKTH